ncbi:MAG: hypothetical protein ACXAC5_02020 [Promethearchaeota archaeon]|jgi:hypothetical protein
MVPQKGPPFKLDHHYGDDELTLFASQMEMVTDEMREWLKSVMNDTESEKFYRGLVTGFAGAFALLQQVPVSEFPNTIHNITAFLAAKVRKMSRVERID